MRGHARTDIFTARGTHAGEARGRGALTFSILASGVIWPKREPKVDLPKRPKPVFGSNRLTSRSVGAMNWPAGRGVGSPALPPLVEPGMPAPATSEAGFPPCKNLHVARKHAPRLKSPHSCSARGQVFMRMSDYMLWGSAAHACNKHVGVALRMLWGSAHRRRRHRRRPRPAGWAAAMACPPCGRRSARRSSVRALRRYGPRGSHDDWG